MLPAKLGADLAEVCILAVRPKLENTEGFGHDEFLLLIVRRWAPVERLQTCERTVPTFFLFWKHASHAAFEHLSRRTLVERTTLWVGVSFLADEAEEFEFIPDICYKYKVGEIVLR